LTIYDLLTRPDPKLTKAQDVEVKKVARALLTRLHDKVAVFDGTDASRPAAMSGGPSRRC
jgi:hypothetical protein